MFTIELKISIDDADADRAMEQIDDCQDMFCTPLEGDDGKREIHVMSHVCADNFDDAVDSAVMMLADAIGDYADGAELIGDAFCSC